MLNNTIDFLAYKLMLSLIKQLMWLCLLELLTNSH